MRDALNYFGAPVATGTYDGSSSVSIPMTNLTAAAPLGSGLAAIRPHRAAVRRVRAGRTTTAAASPPPRPPRRRRRPIRRAPTVSVTAPTAGATLSGTVTLSANASRRRRRRGRAVPGGRRRASAGEDNERAAQRCRAPSGLSAAPTRSRPSRGTRAATRSTSPGVQRDDRQQRAGTADERAHRRVEAEIGESAAQPDGGRASQGETRHLQHHEQRRLRALRREHPEEAGTYVIWGRDAGRRTTALDSFYVTMDGGDQRHLRHRRR